jgi:CubicO group peptidase (beta-lactamase class C family)
VVQVVAGNRRSRWGVRAGVLIPVLRTPRPLVLAVVLALGAPVVHPTNTSAQGPDDPTTAVRAAPAELQEVRGRLVERVRRGESPSFAIGLVRGAEVEWAEAIGWANREAKAAATPDTRYAVASVSKSLTATGAMALVGRGRLRLDTSADPVLASGRRRGTWTGSATLSQLLDHTSGVPHAWHYEYPDRPETIVTRARLIHDDAFLAVPPGRHFLYTNLGYGVVAELVERAEGAPFQRVMERVLFSPLDMRGTTIDAWVGRGTAARGYERDGRAIPYQLRLAPDGGAGFFSTLDDLLRYCQFQLGFLERPEIPPDAVIRSALRSARPGVHYLRGWGVVRLDSVTVLVSDGQMAGASAAVVLVPERDLGAVVLCNATGCPAMETATEMLSALVPGLGDSLNAAWPRLERKLFPPGTIPTEQFEGTLLERDAMVRLKADLVGGTVTMFRSWPDMYRLEDVHWSVGAIEGVLLPATRPVGRDAPHEILLRLWRVGDELRGVLQEEIRDDRPGYARVSGVVLRPVR